MNCCYQILKMFKSTMLKYLSLNNSNPQQKEEEEE